MNKLIKIQEELKAPKSQRNKFGNYNYRSLEDILEAVKPLLVKHEVELTLADEVQEIAGIPVIKVTATLSDGEKEIVRTAVAGVDLAQKGMAIPQTFGSASSYARKYCLNGLFLIDDTKDSDSEDNSDKGGKKQLNANTEEFVKAVQFIKKGGKLDSIKTKYTITKEVENQLLQSIKN
jgi:hypothetical protein